MSERKVISKYYPPDFDHSKIGRTPKSQRPAGLKTIPVRLMAPFSMRCTKCGEYIYKGRKFNARKEETDEKYLSMLVNRFYIKCTRCPNEITWKQDWKNNDYKMERGASRNAEMWRDPQSEELQDTDEQRLDRLQREQMEEAEDKEENVMEELERKMMDSKREEAIADALDEIRTRNARVERGVVGEKEAGALKRTREEVDEGRRREEEELEEEARKAFRGENVKKVKMEVVLEEAGEAGLEDGPVNAHSFEKVQRPRKTNMAPPLVKKAMPVVAKPPQPAVKPARPSPLGLVSYGSDDDDD